jgi:hypothetical protein
MGYVIGGVLGVVTLGAFVWLTHRLRMWRRGDERDRLRSDAQAMSEAEILTRSKGPFV